MLITLAYHLKYTRDLCCGLVSLPGESNFYIGISAEEFLRMVVVKLYFQFMDTQEMQHYFQLPTF